MEPASLAILIKRYINDELSEEEVAQLWNTLQTDNDREQWEVAVTALLEDKISHGLSDPDRMEMVWQAIKPIPPEEKRVIYHKSRWVAAASMLAVIAIGIYFLIPKNNPPQMAAHIPAHQVKPGSNKAVLTLADGSQVTLDSAGNGALATQGNTNVVQQHNGVLAYTHNGETNAGKEIQYNNLSIPRGGQFRLTLADGTRVWLNAASSLRYPTAFTGKERLVELTGEAYFEVAQLPSQPFKVSVNNMEVQVLGTSFNIKAYGEEGVTKTTLLEGAVKIKTGNNETRLVPGQQAQTQNTGQINIRNDIDVEEMVAWKNGYFQFNHEKITGVMQQIARWYDVDVSYQGSVPVREFGGRIARSSSIEEVIRVLELSKIHVKIENKKIIVMP